MHSEEQYRVRSLYKVIRERSGSVVEPLTQDLRALISSLTNFTVLRP